MKLFNKILFGAAAVALATASYSCKEEATLAGADAVYITMADTEINLLVGDTLRLSATVQNASGDEIVTPITWSSSDESVCKIIDIVEYEYTTNPDYKAPEDAGSPEEGEGSEEPASKSDENPEYFVTEIHHVGLVAVPGAQGKITTIKATLENGQYAATTVTIGRNKLTGAITPYSSEGYGEGDYRHTRHAANKSSYIDQLNDTIWFRVDPIQLVDDFEASYTMELTEVAANGDDPKEQQFAFPEESLVVDRADNAVGVVYTAPRLAGKAVCTLTLAIDKDGIAQSESCSSEILICPGISAGLAYEENGVKIYPRYSPESPSNPKPKQSSAALDVNSSYLVEVCMGISSAREDDINLAIAAEKAGYFSWSVDGNAVIVEDQNTSFYQSADGEKYEGGYITYLKVKSGTRPGKVRAKFSIPGQDFTCDLDVIDFKKDYPVEQIIVKVGDTEIGDSYVIDLSTKALSMAVTTIPDASFSFHVPTAVSSDESVLEPTGRDGNNYVFAVKKNGVAKLTFKAIETVREVVVTVNDAIEMISLPEKPVTLYPGSTYELQASIKMFSGAVANETVTFVSTNEDAVSVAYKEGSNNVGVLTAKAIGEAEVYATCGNVRSNSVVVTVAEIADINIISGTGVGRDGNLTLNLQDGTDRITVTLPTIDSKYGQYTGSNATVKVGDITTTGCSYDFTLTKIDERNATIKGYVQMPNGLKYLLDLNITCQFR